MNRKSRFYIIFFSVLIAAFYFVLTKIIPGYGKVELPVLNYVQPFSFVNQEGKTITQKEVSGKVYVAEYFFTTCKGICPKMNVNMKKIYDEFKNENDFLILSHTVDPETDNVQRLRVYSDSLGISPSKWYFLTGGKDSLYKAARVSYLLDDPKNNDTRIEDQFIHTQFFALVDQQGQVRKIYDGLKKDELAELSKDIKSILQEKGLKGNFANNLFN